MFCLRVVPLLLILSTLLLECLFEKVTYQIVTTPKALTGLLKRLFIREIKETN